MLHRTRNCRLGNHTPCWRKNYVEALLSLKFDRERRLSLQLTPQIVSRMIDRDFIYPLKLKNNRFVQSLPKSLNGLSVWIHLRLILFCARWLRQTPTVGKAKVKIVRNSGGEPTWYRLIASAFGVFLYTVWSLACKHRDHALEWNENVQ